MSLLIHVFTLGPLENNTYLVADTWTHEAAVIDPSFEIGRVLKYAKNQGLDIRQVWLTHAHFDHISGVGDMLRVLSEDLKVALHLADLALWNAGGGGAAFGLQLTPARAPDMELAHGQKLTLGNYSVEVRHAPGHTPGHVIFYERDNGVAFCGDVIFRGSIGRTDLPGGSLETLLESIRAQVLTLPDATRLLSGHGPETTVGWERGHNPFL